MNKKLLLLPALLVGAGTAYWWLHERVQKPADTALTLYGNADIREVDLAFGISERIAERLVLERRSVRPGWVPGRLQGAKLEAELAKA